MITMLGLVRVEKPCKQCGDRTSWILQYDSPGLLRFVAFCKRCRQVTVHADSPRHGYEAERQHIVQMLQCLIDGYVFGYPRVDVSGSIAH